MKAFISIIMLGTVVAATQQSVFAQRGGAAAAPSGAGSVSGGMATNNQAAAVTSNANANLSMPTTGQFGVPNFRSLNPNGLAVAQGMPVGAVAPGSSGASADSVTRNPGSQAAANGFGPANFRPNNGQNFPGRAGNLPARGGSENANSGFQGSTSPFAQNSFLGIMSRLPPSAFSPNVAVPTPPSPGSLPQSPPFFPLYLPNGAVNQNVGPNAPMANGQVVSGNAAALTQAAEANASRNGIVFQNGQWWYQAPNGNWEFYRGNRWNMYQPATVSAQTSTTTPTTTMPTSTASTSTPTTPTSASNSASTPAATRTYTYEVPGP
jgi:hypothetical protein